MKSMAHTYRNLCIINNNSQQSKTKSIKSTSSTKYHKFTPSNFKKKNNNNFHIDFTPQKQKVPNKNESSSQNQMNCSRTFQLRERTQQNNIDFQGTIENQQVLNCTKKSQRRLSFISKQLNKSTREKGMKFLQTTSKQISENLQNKSEGSVFQNLVQQYKASYQQLIYYILQQLSKLLQSEEQIQLQNLIDNIKNRFDITKNQLESYKLKFVKKQQICPSKKYDSIDSLQENTKNNFDKRADRRICADLQMYIKTEPFLNQSINKPHAESLRSERIKQSNFLNLSSPLLQNVHPIHSNKNHTQKEQKLILSENINIKKNMNSSDIQKQLSQWKYVTQAEQLNKRKSIIKWQSLSTSTNQRKERSKSIDQKMKGFNEAMGHIKNIIKKN